MKRDLNLIRDLLLVIEELNVPCDLDELVALISDKTKQEIVDHLLLLQNAGYVNLNVVSDMNAAVVSVTINGVTWDGCEYLDSVRDIAIWRKINKALTKSVGCVALEAVKDIALELGKASLRSQLGL